MTADDLGVGGALTVMMRDAIMPTLMQVGVGRQGMRGRGMGEEGVSLCTVSCEVWRLD